MRACVSWALWLSYVLLCVAFYPPRPLQQFTVLCSLECTSMDTRHQHWIVPCFVATRARAPVGAQ